MEHQLSHGSAHVGHDAHAGHGSAEAGGLAVSAHGFTLELDNATLNRGRQLVKFRVTGSDGLPITAFDLSHEKELHFIAVRRDASGFQHVHPVRDAFGHWSVELDLTPGDWRFFADFQPAGHAEAMTLGVDAAVAGHYEPQSLPATEPLVALGDYAVRLEGELTPGEPSKLTLSITRNGAPVTDLDPYLAAYGHMVALRIGDLGYLHVHPEGSPADEGTPAGPEISFVAVAPSAGAYRVYVDFQHAGLVRTAEFTLRARLHSIEGATHTS